MKIKKGKLVAFACMLLASVPVGAAEQASLSPSTGKYDVGIIFNTSDILLSLDTYQAGIGVKIGMGKTAYRGMVNAAYSASTAEGSTSSFSVVAGLAIEYHFLPSPISPYIGAAVSAGYMKIADTATSLPLSAGAILGVEVFPFDFLSLFAEYAVAFDVNIVTDTATATTTTSFLLNTGMGNNAKIGLVLYFTRMKHK
jgi:hypothetical protein